MIAAAVGRLRPGPLTEGDLRAHIWPLFSRVLEYPAKPIYLANHSLGRPLDRTADDIAAGVATWYRDMNEAWDPWMQAQRRFRELTAQLINAPRPECIVPKTAAGQGLRAVLNALSGKPSVVATGGEFDSLDFILRTWRDKGRIDLTLVPARPDGGFDAGDIAQAIAPGTTLVVVSSVMFRTGQVLGGLNDLVRRAHALGAKVLVDVYHGAGVIPTDVQALDADFAVGGSYKYLRGGPGACWLYVRPDHLDALRTLDTGWFAKKDVFAYQRPEPPEYAPGGDGWNESTPPVFASYQSLAGLEFTLAIGVGRLREYSLSLQARLKDLLLEQGIEAEGAREDRGAFLTVRHARAGELASELDVRGVHADARGEYLRLCPDILNPDTELAEAARRVGEAARSLGR
jgi:kynureninase